MRRSYAEPDGPFCDVGQRHGELGEHGIRCGNLGLVSANPCSTMVIAGVAKAGLWGTEDGGKTWRKLGSGAGSAVITNRISGVVYDPAHPGTFWELGIYNGGGVYKTTNNGATFEQLGDVTHTDSISVDFSDPEDERRSLRDPTKRPRSYFAPPTRARRGPTSARCFPPALATVRRPKS